MSFEDKIRSEKALLGYSLSGHPLDGMQDYIEKFSVGLDAIRTLQATRAQTLLEEQAHMDYADSITDESEIGISEMITQDTYPTLESSIAESKATVATTSFTPSPLSSLRDIMHEEESEDEEDNEQGNARYLESKSQAPSIPSPKVAKKTWNQGKPSGTRVRLIGVVTVFKKIQTKSKKMMLVATCETHNMRFQFTLFPKDYDQYEQKVSEYGVVMIDGTLSERQEGLDIEIIASGIRTISISQLHAHAKQLGLWSDQSRVRIGFMENE
jgi:DNA polymerase III alpha subunit